MAITFDGIKAASQIPVEDTSDEGVTRLLSHDPLAGLEEVSGKRMDYSSFHDGLLQVRTHGARKDAVLKARGDTCFVNQLTDYIQIIEAFGFELALQEGFKGRDDSDEFLFVYAKPDEGLILRFDTLWGDRVNAADVYYNFQSYDWSTIDYSIISSGEYRDCDGDRTWVGHHDAREALIFKLETLRRHGMLIPVWKEAPFLWFLHYMDTKEKNFDYKAINARRINQLTPECKAIIGDSYRD